MRPLGSGALALAPIPLGFVGGALVARTFLRATPAGATPGRDAPLVVVTAWGVSGAVAFAILATTLAFVAYVLGRAFAHAPARAALAQSGTRGVIALAFGAIAASLAWPFVFSSDLYAYAAYGELARLGADPYVLAPPSLHDALLDAARRQWSGTFPPCVYGPLFVAFARVVVVATERGGVTATLWTLRVAAALAFLATIACARVALAGLGRERRTTLLAAYALHPVTLWSVAEGHNDAFAMLGVAACAALARRLGTLTIAAAASVALVKASGAVYALVAALDAVLVRRRPLRGALLALVLGVGATAALVLPPLLPAVRALARGGRYAPEISLQGAVGPVAALAIAAACVGAGLTLLFRRRRAGHAWLGLAAVATLPNPYPWYALWLVPLALAAPASAAGRALYAVTILGALRYLPDALGNMSPVAAVASAALVTVPFAYAAAGLRADLVSQKDALSP